MEGNKGKGRARRASWRRVPELTLQDRRMLPRSGKRTFLTEMRVCPRMGGGVACFQGENMPEELY